jgi:hypothetical protein
MKRQKFTDVSEEHIFIFMGEEYAKKKRNKQSDASLLCLLFNSEDGGDAFL